MHRKGVVRASLAALIAVALAFSLAHASAETGGRELTLSHTFTLAELADRLPVVHFALHNPFYDGRLKVYRGFYLADVIRLITSDEDAVIHFEALDGYKVSMDISGLFSDPEIVGIVAFEEIGVPGGFEPVSYGGRYVEDAGPFWLVWGHIDPSQVTDGGESLVKEKLWPWQLAEIRIEH